MYIADFDDRGCLFLVSRHLVKGESWKWCHCGNLYTHKTDTSLITPTLCCDPFGGHIREVRLYTFSNTCNQYTCVQFLNADGFGSSILFKSSCRRALRIARQRLFWHIAHILPQDTLWWIVFKNHNFKFQRFFVFEKKFESMKMRPKCVFRPVECPK